MANDPFAQYAVSPDKPNPSPAPAGDPFAKYAVGSPQASSGSNPEPAIPSAPPSSDPFAAYAVSRPNNGQPEVAEAPPQHLYQDPNQSWWKRGLDFANTPIVDFTHLMSKEGAIGQAFGRTSEQGGFERGAENLVSGFTAPLSLALTAATFGTGGLIESAGATALKEAGLSAAEIADAAKGSEAALQAFKAQKDIEPVIQSALEAGGHDLGLLQRAKEATSNLVPDTNFGEPAVQNVLEKAGFSEADRAALAKASDTVSEARAGFKPVEDAVRDAGVDVDKWKQAQDILYKNGLTEQDLLGGNMVERGAFQILRKAVPTLPVAATARAAKTANAVLNAGFTYQQLEMAAQMSPRFLDALKEGDYDHAWEYGTEAVAGGAFGLLGAPHALHAAGELFKPLIENESFRPNDHWLAIDRANKEREAQHAVAEQHAINIDQHARELLGHEGPRPIIGDTAEVQGQKADELAATHLWRDVGQGSQETAAAWHDALAEAAGSEDRVGTQIPNVRNDGGGAGQAPPGTPIAPDEVPPRANTTVLHSNTAGEVRVGADGRPVVWLSPDAWGHFNSAVEPENAIKGVSYSPDEADRISNALAKIGPGQEIEDLFQEAQRASKQNLLTASASPEKLGTETAVRVVSEELHHTWQRELSKDGDVANHLNPEGFTRLRGIIPEAWTKQQDEYGYDKDPIVRVVETAAQFMAGRAGDHVSVSDQARWLGEYFREVEAKHGKEALNSLDNINEIARQHVEDINARKAAADRTTEERANRGSVSGVQERPAGFGGLGQAEPAPGLAARVAEPEQDLRRVYHWSRKPAFTETNPAMEGTGVRGAGTNRQFIPGTYFGEENYREPMVQGNANKYYANLDYNKIYDRNADPLGLSQQARDLARKNGDSPEFNLEKLIQQNGFEGYRAQGVIKYFKPVPVVPFSAEAPGLFSRENSDWNGIKKYLTPEELTKHDTPEKQNSLVAAFNSLPNAEEWHAAVQAGRAGQMWYERSSRAFDALLDSGFTRLHPQDKDKFLNFVAALSPVQPVKTNLLMALEQWTKWDKAGRPTDVVWKDGKPNKSSKLYQMMRKGVDLQSRLGNAIRALQGEPLSGPKVSSFTKNLGTDTSRVTNDTWMAVLAGQDPGRINKPATYDAMSAKIREAADAHGIAPRQAQAAAWSFIKSLAELSGWGNDRWIPPQEIIKQGLLTPDLVASHSADFADLLQNDPQIRGLITKLGGDINAFDEKFKSYVPNHPAQGEAAGVSDRLLGAAGRLEAARANAGIQRHLEAKSGPQSSFDFQRASDFNPAFMDEHTGAGTGIGAKYMPLYARERQPNEDVDRLASAYTASQGINKPAHAGLAPVDTGLSKRVADAYEAMKHNPESPKTKAAYEALKTETKAQWDAAEKAGYKFEPWTKPGQPYANSAEMAADVRDNKHLYYFPGGDIPKDHPLADVDPKTGETYNNIFRAVHDLFGHAKNDYEFGPRGEENAFLAHSRMYSDKAVPALLSETKGQNSWVNFGPHLRDENGNVPVRGETGYVPPTERPFAEQKAGLLPDNLVRESVRPNNGLFAKAQGLPSNIDDMIRDNKFKTLPKEYQDRVLGALKKLATGQMSDRETAAAKYLAQEQDKNYEIGSANDLLHNYLEDYMTRVYKDANPEGRVILSNAKQGKFATNVNMARQRVYESTLTALLKSPKEMLLDPVSVTAQGRAQLIKAAANWQFIDKLRDNFTRASDGRPAVVLSGQGQVVAGQNGEDPKTFISPDRVRKINIADAAVQSMQKSGDLQRFLDEGTIKDITPYVRPNNINAAIDRLETQSQSKEAQYDQVGNNKLQTQIMYLKSMLNNKDFSGLKDFNDQLDKKYAWDPQDYISLNNGAMKGWNFVTNDSAGNGVLVKSDIRVHPEFAQYLKDRLGLEPSAIAKNPIGKALLGAGTKLKHTLLSLSPFHMVQIALRGVMTGVNPFTLNGPDILNGAKVDPTDPNSPTKMYKMVEQGMTTGTDYRALQEHSEGVSAGGNSLRLIPGVGKTIANSLDSYQDFLFKRYIPAIKATAAEHMFDEYQRLHPEWSTDKIAKMAGQHANDSFGGINWKAMGRSATTQDWGRLMLLAPDWLESEMRSGARLFNGEEGGLGRAQVAKMALGLWGIARVLNYVTTGSFHNEAPFGLVHKNKDGKEIAYGIRTLPTDLLHAASDPVGFIKGRLSPSIRMGQELLTQRDQFGRKLAPSDMWADVFHNLSPIPLQSLGQAVSGTGPEIGNTGQIVKALGGTAQTYQSPAQKMAADLASNHTEDGPIDPSKMARHRRVMQLEDQARSGQISWPDLMKLTYQTDQLHESELKQIQNNIKKTQGMDPAMASLYTRAARLPAKEYLQLLDTMNPAEKTALTPLTLQVQKKYLAKSKKEMTPTERQNDPTFQRLLRMIPGSSSVGTQSHVSSLPESIQKEVSYLYRATHPGTGHRVGSNNGTDWFDASTGEPMPA